jgi:CBS domain-containing protein
MGRKDATAQLPVRRRRTLHGDGTSSEAMGVHCPTRDRFVDLVECETCPQCLEIELREGPGSRVTCRPPEKARGLRDRLTKKVLPTAADRAPISSLMSTEVICVAPDLSIDALKLLLSERGISGAPVVDDLGWPIGVISRTDVLRCADSASRATLTVENVMMPIAYTLRDSDSIARAAAVMAIEGVHRLPIVDEDGRVVGILSTIDLARWLAVEAGYIDKGLQ